MMKPGSLIEVGVSEPADLFREAGDGPYPGSVRAVSDYRLEIVFERPLQFRGARFAKCSARPRYNGDSFVHWDGEKAIVVNIMPNVKIAGVTHLIGSVRIRET